MPEVFQVICLSQGRLMSCMERRNDVNGVAMIEYQKVTQQTRTGGFLTKTSGT